MQHGGDQAAIALLLEAERPRIVRLCAQLAGAAAAEDLAQETLLEAWRQQHRLTDWSGAPRWLSAIARFVCLRWRRRQGQEWARSAPASAPDAPSPTDLLADELDLEQLLEEQELAGLVEQALELLPADLRRLLLLRYVHELPQTAIAEQLQISQGAVAMRLQRGRQAVRRVLGGELGPAAAAYGLAEQKLSIWCPFCGQDRLVLSRREEVLDFRCPSCAASGVAQHIVSTVPDVWIADLRHPRTVLSRALAYCHSFYRAALDSGSASCRRCGGTRLVGIDGEALVMPCQRCGHTEHADIRYLALDHPATQQFWKAHPRMQMLPNRHISYGGSDALLTCFASRSGDMRIELVSLAETLKVVAVEIERGTQ